jgi:hypothetical protein
MAFVEVEDCQTAADVMRVARAAAERRRKGYATAKVQFPASRPKIVSAPQIVDKTPSDPRLAYVWAGGWTAVEPLPEGAQMQIRLTVKEILIATAKVYGVTSVQIFSMLQDKRTSQARHVAWVIARCLTGQSLTSIGHHSAGRDHTSVRHALLKLEWLQARLVEQLEPEDGLDAWIKLAHELHPSSRPLPRPTRPTTRKRGPRRHSLERVKQIMSLRETGMTWYAIADQIGVTRNVVSGLVSRNRQHGWV